LAVAARQWGARRAEGAGNRSGPRFPRRAIHGQVVCELDTVADEWRYLVGPDESVALACHGADRSGHEEREVAVGWIDRMPVHSMRTVWRRGIAGSCPLSGRALQATHRSRAFDRARATRRGVFVWPARGLARARAFIAELEGPACRAARGARLTFSRSQADRTGSSPVKPGRWFAGNGSGGSPC
jgi:hypothetical protein